MNKLLKQHGFASMELVLAVVLTVAIAFAAYTVINNDNDQFVETNLPTYSLDKSKQEAKANPIESTAGIDAEISELDNLDLDAELDTSELEADIDAL